jgi:hypothetical protein
MWHAKEIRNACRMLVRKPERKILPVARRAESHPNRGRVIVIVRPLFLSKRRSHFETRESLERTKI